jgi:hypothetical protein
MNNHTGLFEELRDFLGEVRTDCIFHERRSKQLLQRLDKFLEDVPNADEYELGCMEVVLEIAEDDAAKKELEKQYGVGFIDLIFTARLLHQATTEGGVDA